VKFTIPGSALHVDQSFELRAAHQVDALQHRAGTALFSLLPPGRTDRGVEAPRIGAHDRGVPAQLGAARDDHLRPAAESYDPLRREPMS
jgi:hypothetical protein